MELTSNANAEQTEIQKFYDGTNVFITGGTGFLGKILIEKLLRSTNVSMIYILIREKKGKSMSSRVDEFFDDVMFERLKYECPKYRHKVVGVAGDCSITGLGLNINDRMTLAQNINIVFNVAATVNFDEHLKLAYAINVGGTNGCLELCKQMKSLKAFMHVSTAFSNCIVDKIEEKFYDYPVGYQDVADILNKMTEKEVTKNTPTILGKWPNSYVFTKAMAEDMIRKEGGGIPVGVFRPSIVISTYKEPVEGWINNLYGPTGVCVGAASGVLRTLQCDTSSIANIVPVDTCVAALICSAWEVGTMQSERTPQNIPIYNYVSTVENPIVWEEFNHLNIVNYTKYPFSKSVWSLTYQPTKHELLYNIYKVFYHYLPAVVLDSFSMMLLQRPRLLKMYRKVHKFSSVVAYFCKRDWTWTNDNVQRLYERISDKDKELFPFSMKNVLWLTYFKTYFRGIREYLLKDPMNTLEIARSRQNKLSIAHNVLKFTVSYVSVNVVLNQMANMLYFVLGIENNC